MSDGIRYTKWFVVLTVFLVAIYDMIAIFVWGVDASISRIVGVDASFDAPTIPFAFGFMMGHLFWSQPRKKKEE